jgi:aerobic-type carbon monoxide dehydrogenase small subunit (CoxS/CutS family)
MNYRPNITLVIPDESDDPKMSISLRINGHKVTRTVSTRMHLADFIRHEIGLTGTHVGCEHGVCGACSILLNGRSVRSCLMFAVQADGADLKTIESEASADGTLSVLQQAFEDCHGLQCGFCTPGMIMNIRSHFESGEKLDLSDDGIREIISGNLCRCTGYANIISAVRQAAQQLGKG